MGSARRSSRPWGAVAASCYAAQWQLVFSPHFSKKRTSHGFDPTKAFQHRRPLLSCGALHAAGLASAARCPSRGLFMALKCSGVDALAGLADKVFWDELESELGVVTCRIQVCLRGLCAKLDKDLVVFFNGAEGLQDQPLPVFLTRLKSGCAAREKIRFPRSIALIGLSSINYCNDRIR